MLIRITLVPHYPKNARRHPTVTAIAHLPGASRLSEPRHEIEILPRPGYTGSDVAAKTFGVREPIPLEVDAGFWEMDTEDVQPIILAAVRDAVRARRR